MRIALLADLHGNLPALLAAHDYLSAHPVDAVYCLGDLVGKGPSSPETMDWALAHCDVVLGGNWDFAIAEIARKRSANNWYVRQLGMERAKRLGLLPEDHRFTLSGRRFRLLHGRPTVSFVPSAEDPDALAQLFDTPDGYRPDIVICADSHRPFWIQRTSPGTTLNTGSVGNALGGQPYATFMLLEGTPGDAIAPLLHTVVQLPYDREAALRDAIAADGLPAKEAYLQEIRTGVYARNLRP